jgi:uncharacterized protein (TIGR00251 family)
MADWLQVAADGSLTLTLHIQPGAKRTGFAGLYGEAAKIRLAAPPVDGKANAALCAFLAEVCGVPKSAVSLVSGETSRAKRVRIGVGIGFAAGQGVAERLRLAVAAS